MCGMPPFWRYSGALYIFALHVFVTVGGIMILGCAIRAVDERRPACSPDPAWFELIRMSSYRAEIFGIVPITALPIGWCFFCFRTRESGSSRPLTRADLGAPWKPSRGRTVGKKCAHSC